MVTSHKLPEAIQIQRFWVLILIQRLLLVTMLYAKQTAAKMKKCNHFLKAIRGPTLGQDKESIIISHINQ